jgi:7,8-dihydropterin-6-yl-methyl-4-(beta-D-ribofuranosyl)aminobenzene 5'-phosphate synthase
MRLTCLVDNCVMRGSPLWGAHGLSFLIEAQGGDVLWDVGPAPEVLRHNLRALGLEQTPLAAIALSHAHDDHVGGLAAALELGPKAPIFANEGILEPRYSIRGGKPQAIGLDRSPLLPQVRDRLHLSAAPQEIVAGVRTSGVIGPRPFPLGASQHHRIKEGDALVQDPYHDDMSLVLEAGDGIVLLCGCCHAGLRNTLATLRAQDKRPLLAILGGTHLEAASDAELEQLIQALRAAGSPQLYLNHCTGERAIWKLHHALGDCVTACPAGTVLDLG